MIGVVPVGAIVFAAIILIAVAPFRRPRWLAQLSWMVGTVPNEIPFVAIAIVAVSIGPSIIGGELPPGGWSVVGLNLLALAGLVLVVRRALRTGDSLDHAMNAGLGASWRAAIDPVLSKQTRQRLPWLRILVFPFPVRPRSVERVKDIPYGDKGTSNMLDVYRHRSRPTGGATLIHLHGGRFRRGAKSREARPLLHHLARQGWTCISANYQLSRSPAAGFPEHLVDVKRVIAWARTHGQQYGVDPDAIFLSGSSAGAHLTAMATLTPGDPRFQPGFETADTSIAAAIGLYGYYGALGGDAHPPTTPLAYVNRTAPPFLILHGDIDTCVPAEGARELASHLGAVSDNPVVYAELAGAQHAFDLAHSIRFDTVVDAVELFAAWVRSGCVRSSHG